MKILITGASGFIGGFVLSEALRRGHQVWALVRSQEPQEWQDAKQLEVLRCDLRRADTLDLKGGGIDVVLHMAAATRAGAAEHFQDTVMGTRNLLHAAREAGIHRIVGISSIAVLGYRSLQPMTVIDEAVAVTRGETLGVYATAKLQQEDLFLFFGHEGGNSCVILRPGLCTTSRGCLPHTRGSSGVASACWLVIVVKCLRSRSMVPQKRSSMRPNSRRPAAK